jgi:hypothetical protein
MLNIRINECIGIPILVLAVMAIGAARASATTCVSWNAFPKTNVPTVGAKLTFVGEQERPVRSVGLTVNGAPVDVILLSACKKPDITYSGDTLPLNLNSLSLGEMANILQAAGSIPAVVAGGAAAQAYLSLSLYDSASNSGFEVVLDKPNGSSLLQAIRTALAANTTALRSINSLGCSTELREPGTPTDASNSVQVTISGLRLNRTTGRFVATAAITNKSSSPILGPISAVFVFGGQVRMHAPSGLTCGLSPPGWGYLDLPLQDNALAVGGTVNLTLDLDNASAEPVSATTKVYAGPGGR